MQLKSAHAVGDRKVGVIEDMNCGPHEGMGIAPDIQKTRLLDRLFNFSLLRLHNIYQVLSEAALFPNVRVVHDRIGIADDQNPP